MEEIIKVIVREKGKVILEFETPANLTYKVREEVRKRIKRNGKYMFRIGNGNEWHELNITSYKCNS